MLKIIKEQQENSNKSEVVSTIIKDIRDFLTKNPEYVSGSRYETSDYRGFHTSNIRQPQIYKNIGVTKSSISIKYYGEAAMKYDSEEMEKLSQEVESIALNYIDNPKVTYKAMRASDQRTPVWVVKLQFQNDHSR